MNILSRYCCLIAFLFVSILAAGCLDSNIDEFRLLSVETSVPTEITLGRVKNEQQILRMQPSDETYKGLPVGFTDEGYPYIGAPNALVTIEEFSDYLCPFCGRHFNQTTPTLFKEYVETGLVRLVFREFPIASLHPTAHFGSAAALCAGEQGAALFWTMHDELFQRQSEWSSLPEPSDFLTDVADDIGLDIKQYSDCVDSEKIQDIIDAGISEAQALGLTGTPSFQFASSELDEHFTLVGAQPLSVFSQWIDALLAGEEPPVEPEPEAPELPFWANEEGLQPDLENPGHTLAGDQYKGDLNAPIVVVEFSDFQCPACARHSNDVQPILDETFVDSGAVRWVFKHLPLKEHEFAPVSASAAECAAEQGAFWEMHDLLYQSVEAWAGPVEEESVLESFDLVFGDEQGDDAEQSTEQQDEVSSDRTIDDVETALIELAENLELDKEAFETCLSSRQALERVLRDIYDAQGVVQQTPTFVILYGGQGALLRGAKDVESFTSTLESYVELASEEAVTEDVDESP